MLQPILRVLIFTRADLVRSIQVYVSPHDTHGLAILIKNERVLETVKVIASGNGDTFAIVTGQGLELTVDAENNDSGKLEFKLGKKIQTINFGEQECGHLPRNWPS